MRLAECPSCGTLRVLVQWRKGDHGPPRVRSHGDQCRRRVIHPDAQITQLDRKAPAEPQQPGTGNCPGCGHALAVHLPTWCAVVTARVQCPCPGLQQ